MNPLTDRNLVNKNIFVVSQPKCEDSAFQVAWNINAHMKVGAVNKAEAQKQHHIFRRELHRAGAEILEVPFVRGAYDSVFVKDNAVLTSVDSQLLAFLANPKCPERKTEQASRRLALESLGFKVGGPPALPFEGGDLVVVASMRQAFLGYGFRSDIGVKKEIEEFLGMEVIPLQLRDPHFYHLDTALAVLRDGTAFACRDAFTDESWAKLCSASSIHTLIQVSRAEAMKFALNMVEVDNTVVVGSFVPDVIRALQDHGREVRVTPLQQFQFAGGSAACLTAQIHQLPG